MRRTSLSILAVALILFAVPAEGQTLKIGYINSQEILAAAPGAAEAQKQFDQDVQTYQAEVQQLQEELNKMQEALQQQSLTLSPEAKSNREQAIRIKAQEYQQRVSELDQQAAQRRQELVQPVMDRITAVIETMREEGNYALILDVAGGSIISADPSLDLTQEVIRRVKAAGTTTGVGH